MSLTPNAISVSIVQSCVSVVSANSEVVIDSTTIVSDVDVSESCASVDHKSVTIDDDQEKQPGASTINAKGQTSTTRVLRREVPKP